MVKKLSFSAVLNKIEWIKFRARKHIRMPKNKSKKPRKKARKTSKWPRLSKRDKISNNNNKSSLEASTRKSRK
jgi:hypothetical protein